MADKQYYVKVDFEYGVDNGDGTLEPKQTGNLHTVSMPYDNAVMFQASAILPAWKMMLDEAMKLGLIKAGIVDSKPPGQVKR